MGVKIQNRGFALPAVFVTSIIMMIVLFSVLASVTSFDASLNQQYYEQLARDAAEAGATYADDCMTIVYGVAASGEWSNSNSTKIETGDNCSGSVASGLTCGAVTSPSACFVVNAGNVRSYYVIDPFVFSGYAYTLRIHGYADIYSDSGVKIRSFTHDLNVSGSGGQYGIASGNDASCSIQLGQLYCWGKNESGQVGDGTTTNRKTPYHVQGALAGKIVQFVATGFSHTCAIAGNTPNPADGNEIYCWGDNSKYQYGNNSNVSSLVPVLAGTSHSSYYYTGVSARDHTCTMTYNAASSYHSRVYCWGDNDHGEAGEQDSGDTTPTVINPKKVRAASARKEPGNSLLYDITDLANVSDNFTCAINDLEVWCWGINSSGQLGDGTQSSSDHARALRPTGMTNATKVVTNNAHACAINSNRLWCWGDNDTGDSKPHWAIDSGPAVVQPSGQTMAVNENIESPTRIITSASPYYHYDISDIAITDSAGCVVSSGDVYCWGYNNFGQLGQGNNYDYPGQKGIGTNPQVSVWVGESSASKVRPANDMVKVSGALVGKEVVKVTGGNDHFCAVTDMRRVYCWGSNIYAQLGDGTTIDRYMPAEVQTAATSIY